MAKSKALEEYNFTVMAQLTPFTAQNSCVIRGMFHQQQQQGLATQDTFTLQEQPWYTSGNSSSSNNNKQAS